VTHRSGVPSIDCGNRGLAFGVHEALKASTFHTVVAMLESKGEQAGVKRVLKGGYNQKATQEGVKRVLKGGYIQKGDAEAMNKQAKHRATKGCLIYSQSELSLQAEKNSAKRGVLKLHTTQGEGGSTRRPRSDALKSISGSSLCTIIAPVLLFSLPPPYSAS